MYYFAYGSSMNFHHMRRMCGWHFTMLGMATLPDFEFGLDTRGYVAVRPKVGSKVFGVLYKIDQYCLGAMDEYEGYPNVFNRAELLVKDKENNGFQAWVYLEKPEEFGGTAIKRDHLSMVVAGAMSSHLPQKWIDFLESFEKYSDN